MAVKEVKTLVLKRVPPGDQWADIEDSTAGVFPSLTDGLEHSFQKSGGKNTEFHLSAFKGEIYAVHKEEEPDAPPPPKPRYSMYGEEADVQPSMWKKGE
jgi:hypothetical protein|tara:strand:- start:336 stop:632 length:297 start_codon:yes stop_codon:yes gene_type:complete